MLKVKLLFGVHCHQPVGDFGPDQEAAYERAYLPFLRTLEAHPRVKFAAHYSGALLDWLIKERPEFVELMKKLVKRGQLELLTSGYYAPVLCLIPGEDKLGQIAMANDVLRQHFFLAPRGMWLTAGAWEPDLPKTLARAGVEYVLLNEAVFLEAGVPPERLFGYSIADEEGDMLRLFPINRRLGEMAGSQPPEAVIEYLRDIPNPVGKAAAVLVLEGEAIEPDCLERLLSLIEENSSLIEPLSFSAYLDEYPAQGRAYLPAAAASTDQRSFLVQCFEANNLHKKMLRVSQSLNTLSRGKTIFGVEKKKEDLKQARIELYKGQCGCAYGGGNPQGVYQGHLRGAAYSHLIRAEAEMEKQSHGGRSFVELAVCDLDKDGRDEVILSNDLLNLYFAPGRGGALFELDYKPKAINLCNTLGRDNDRHPRFCLLDHFLSPEDDLERFRASGYREAGDFIPNGYHFMPNRKPSEVGIRLSREGTVDGAPVRVERSVALFCRHSIFTVDYEVKNLGPETDEFRFGVEFNLGLPGKAGEVHEATVLKLVDEKNAFDVSLEFDKPALLWQFPVERRGRGPASEFQSSCVLASWKFRLAPEEGWRVKLTLRVEE